MTDEKLEMIEAQISAVEKLTRAMDIMERGIEWKFNALADLIVETENIAPEILDRAESVLHRAAMREPAGLAAYIRVRSLRLPKFLEGVELPDSYFLPPNPYADAPSCGIDLGAFAKYARALGKLPAEVTREELDDFLRQQNSKFKLWVEPSHSTS